MDISVLQQEKGVGQVKYLDGITVLSFSTLYSLASCCTIIESTVWLVGIQSILSSCVDMHMIELPILTT